MEAFGGVAGVDWDFGFGFTVTDSLFFGWLPFAVAAGLVSWGIQRPPVGAEDLDPLPVLDGDRLGAPAPPAAPAG